MSALEVADLRKRYGRVRALQGVSFSVAPGEIFGYLGPNGAGKTTTLRILTGLVRADGGTVRLLGDATGRARVRERVGYLPGELRLYGDMTARAALEHLARYRRSRPPVLRERLLAAFGLGADDLGRRVKFLSHGTKQKVGLVAALQHDPDLLLLDEPTNGLDPLVQRGIKICRQNAVYQILVRHRRQQQVRPVDTQVARLIPAPVNKLFHPFRARPGRTEFIHYKGILAHSRRRGPGVAQEGMVLMRTKLFNDFTGTWNS